MVVRQVCGAVGVQAPAHSVLANLTTSASRTARSTVVEHGTVESRVALPEKRAVLHEQLQGLGACSILGGELAVLKGPQNTLEGGTSPFVLLCHDAASSVMLPAAPSNRTR